MLSRSDDVLDASVTVMCQNEARRIGACLASIAQARRGQAVGVCVIVNGSTDASAATAVETCSTHGLDARIYTIAHADKSNAINQAIGPLRRTANLHVFVDAYVTIASTAIRAFAETLSGDTLASAATGLAGNGRTMTTTVEPTVRDGGRLHGQLHAFRPAFLDRMDAQGIRLPVDLYRGDSLLASMVCHDLDATGQPWNGHRIAAARQAIFEIPQLSPLRPRDIARQFRRKIRQMRGRLENEAVKSVIYKTGFAGLPDNADDMIATWLEGGGQPNAGLPDRPFMALALRRHARSPRPSQADLQPVLLHQTS